MTIGGYVPAFFYKPRVIHPGLALPNFALAMVAFSVDLSPWLPDKGCHRAASPGGFTKKQEVNMDSLGSNGDHGD